MRENTDQKKLCIWTLFTQCALRSLKVKSNIYYSEYFVLVYYYYSEMSQFAHFVVIAHYCYTPYTDSVVLCQSDSILFARKFGGEDSQCSLSCRVLSGSLV